MHFDADAYVSNLEPPAITIGGRTFTGRHLSAEQVMRLQPKLAAVNELEDSVERHIKGLRLLMDAMFPPPPIWAPWRPWVWLRLMKEPLRVQIAASRHFSALLAASLTESETTAPPPAAHFSAPAAPGLSSSPASSPPSPAGTTTPAAGSPPTA